MVSFGRSPRRSMNSGKESKARGGAFSRFSSNPLAAVVDHSTARPRSAPGAFRRSPARS